MMRLGSDRHVRQAFQPDLTFLYVGFSSLTCLPDLNDHGETGSGWKAGHTNPRVPI
jgi:hypothetical protein